MKPISAEKQLHKMVRLGLELNSTVESQQKEGNSSCRNVIFKGCILMDLSLSQEFLLN